MPGLFNWGSRKGSGVAAPSAAARSDDDLIVSSKVLPRFLSALSPITAPVLLNLGSVIGQNVSFFGDRLSCKIFVEDLFAEVDAHASKGPAAVGAAIGARLNHPDGSIDGILCWDLFDFLDKPTSQALAARLVKLLKRDGAIYAFFANAPTEVVHYTRFIVDSPDSLRLRPGPAHKARRNVLVTRDINKMFLGMRVSESILLKSGSRETLFRKD